MRVNEPGHQFIQSLPSTQPSSLTPHLLRFTVTVLVLALGYRGDQGSKSRGGLP